MMVNSCSADGCSSTSDIRNNLLFHKFPLNDKDRLEKWIHFVGLKDFKPSSSSTLCSLHFSEEDYSPILTEKPMLKKCAVPAILQTSNNLIPKVNERKILQQSVEIQKCNKGFEFLIKNNASLHVCEVKKIGPRPILPHPAQKDTVLLPELDIQTLLIQLVKARPPLWNNKLKMMDRNESVKNMLWNEVFWQMNAVLKINELKSKWIYLKEKYTREKKKIEKGIIKDGKNIWIHFTSLVFLNEANERKINKNKVTTNLNLEASSIDRNKKVECPQINKRKRIVNLQSQLLELNQTRTPLEDDEYLTFAKYLASLLKDVPQRKQRKLQAEIVTKVINEIDD